jgi:tRNA/rRNA methyltransferase
MPTGHRRNRNPRVYPPVTVSEGPFSAPNAAPVAAPDAAPVAAPAAAAPTDGTRFVLMHTSHPGNVGAAARAMKVMGFADLVLVQPRFADVLSQEETVAFASGAADILARARIVDTLAQALEGITFACATAMTPRDFGPPTHAPRERLPALAAEVHAGAQRVAFVFGSERYGMTNEAVWACQACLSIPTHPDYGSLNLAQALQLLAYDWRQALGGFGVVARTAAPVRADGAAIDGLLAHWQAALVAVGFLDPAAPRRVLPRLRQLLNRAQPRHDELQILRGIARAIIDVARRQPPPSA